MPTPKRKLSRKRRDQRSANKHIIPQPFSFCKELECGAPIMPHIVCSKCGFYRGKKIIKIKAIKVKKENNVTLANKEETALNQQN